MLINKTVLYVSEAASVLSCPPYHVYRLIHSGVLKAYKDEGCRAWHIPEQSIMDYINLRISVQYPNDPNKTA